MVLDLKMDGNQKSFLKPRDLEYPEYFRPGMGTENAAPFLRSMVQMLRPNRILEIGAGYTTPFLLEGLVNNERVFVDGNLNQDYLINDHYNPKLVVIDDMSLGDLEKRPGMDVIIKSNYVDFVEGLFQGKANNLLEKYGKFDFVWFDCGGSPEYEAFFSEYWDICSAYVICHFTYTKGEPNEKLRTLLNRITGEPFKIDILEPHKTRQGSLTILKKG